ncbi:MAG: hypothetical protein MUF83_13095 [Acidimicrobiales bacterium]|nr:hypothetical protein [Acidimicrobiales bacterium]
MRTRLVFWITLAVGVLLASATAAVAADVTNIPESTVSIDCDGWAVAGIPFDVDPDGDGQVTVTVEAWSGSLFGPTLTEDSFTYLVGTTHDLAGSWSTTPTMNPIVLHLRQDAQPPDQSPLQVTFNGSCDAVTIWQQPFAAVDYVVDGHESGPPTIGTTSVSVFTGASCYGTTLELRLSGPDGAVLSEVTTASTTRVDDKAPPVLMAVPGGLPAGGNSLEAVCGSFLAPLSAVYLTTVFGQPATVPGTAPGSASSTTTTATARPAAAAPTYTG